MSPAALSEGGSASAPRVEIDERRDAFLKLIGVKPVIMGILNVTPDSFSDGGRFQSLDLALAQARKLVADGADIIDVGAESTRPGHTPVPLDEEWRRLEPLLAPLMAEVAAPFSIDTHKAEIARRAVALGVCVVNDVWGLQKDPAMADVVAESGVSGGDHAQPGRASILISTSKPTSAASLIARSRSPIAPAFRGRASCSIRA